MMSQLAGYQRLSMLDRAWAAAQLFYVQAVFWLSSIPVAFWRFKGPVALTISVLFTVSCIAVVLKPSAKRILANTMLGVVWFVGRGGAFLEFAIENDSPNLYASSYREAVAGSVAAIAVGSYGAYRAIRQEAVEDADSARG